MNQNKYKIQKNIGNNVNKIFKNHFHFMNKLLIDGIQHNKIN